MRPSNALITPEGYPFIAYSAGLFLFLAAGARYCQTQLFWRFLLELRSCWSCLLFHFSVILSGHRRLIQTLLVAPADGTIVYVGPATQEHLGACQKISIFMSVFNVHVNRAPITGSVVDVFTSRVSSMMPAMPMPPVKMNSAVW
jgi:phosphatidylserine decarboxylase